MTPNNDLTGGELFVDNPTRTRAQSEWNWKYGMKDFMLDSRHGIQGMIDSIFDHFDIVRPEKANKYFRKYEANDDQGDNLPIDIYFADSRTAYNRKLGNTFGMYGFGQDGRMLCDCCGRSFYQGFQGMNYICETCQPHVFQGNQGNFQL